MSLFRGPEPDRGAMTATLRAVRSANTIVNEVDHGSYLAVFTPIDVGHIWHDGSLSWESEQA